MDPRTSVIDKRIEGKRIIAVSGAKGGIGKSLVSCLTALNLTNMGYRVGLLDLDFSSPSDHTIIGVNDIQPDEKNGIIPPKVYGIRFMSIFFYSGNKPSPLRGLDVTNIIREIFCITKWEDVDVIIIDMPPGMGEPVLDMINTIKNMEFVVLTTPSKLSINTVNKFISLLDDFRVPILGVIENMRLKKSSECFFGERFLGSIKFDLDLEESIGNPEALSKTNFSRELREILEKIF